MDAPEPETPFAAVSAQTTKFQRVSLSDEDAAGDGPPYHQCQEEETECVDKLKQIYQNYLDKSTPYTTYRWIATATLFVLFGLRIVFAQGWYIGT